MHHFTAGTKSHLQAIVQIIFGCDFQKAEHSDKESWRLKSKSYVRVETGTPLKEDEGNKRRCVCV